MSFFSKDNVVHFENIVIDEKISVVPLLEASRGIVKMIDLFGTSFKPVKSDLNGNIEKMKKKYDMDPEKFKTVEDMLEEELATKSTKHASEGGLWLLRGLKFLCGIIQGLLREFKESVTTDSVKPILTKAYEDTLKKYHGFVVQKVFSGVSSFAPYRKDLEKKLMLDKDGVTKDQLYAEMEEYIQSMLPVLDMLGQLYLTKDLDTDKKV